MFSSYTDSNRLIVCAALLGRVYAIGSTMTDGKLIPVLYVRTCTYT